MISEFFEILFRFTTQFDTLYAERLQIPMTRTRKSNNPHASRGNVIS